MAITDELRLFAADPYTGWVPTDKQQADLRAIADRIDAEHEADVSTACRLAAGLDNDALAKRGYIALPLDADGVPIYVGDRLDGYGKTIEVVELRYGRSGWVIVSKDGNAYADSFAFTHHHAPTVEDVLREFALACEDAGNAGPEVERIAAEYAKRLTLTGDDA